MAEKNWPNRRALEDLVAEGVVHEIAAVLDRFQVSRRDRLFIFAALLAGSAFYAGKQLVRSVLLGGDSNG